MCGASVYKSAYVIELLKLIKLSVFTGGIILSKFSAYTSVFIKLNGQTLMVSRMEMCKTNYIPNYNVVSTSWETH